MSNSGVLVTGNGNHTAFKAEMVTDAFLHVTKGRHFWPWLLKSVTTAL